MFISRFKYLKWRARFRHFCSEDVLERWRVQKPKTVTQNYCSPFAPLLPAMTDDRASNSEKHKDDVVTTELVIQADTENVFEHGSLDPVYAAKAKILNDSLQEIGMGKYQWYLFVVAGFGWFSDNLWPVNRVFSLYDRQFDHHNCL